MIELPKIGDAVEIREMRLTDENTMNVEHIWRPATVVFSDDNQIGVAFADGERMAIPLRGGRSWRRV